MTRTDTQPQHANPATRAVLLCAVFAFFGLGMVAATLRLLASPALGAAPNPLAIESDVLTFLSVAPFAAAGLFAAMWWDAQRDAPSRATASATGSPYDDIFLSDACKALTSELDTACLKVLDENCSVLAMNQACVDFLEAESADQFIGINATEYLTPSDKARYIEAIKKAADGEISEVEYELTGVHGTRRWLLQRAKRIEIPGTDPSVRKVLCLTREVTQSKLIKDRLDMAIDITRQGLWDEWIQTGEIYYNENWYTMLGYEPGELKQTTATWHELVHPDDLDAAQAEFKKHIRGETETYRAQYRMKAKGGSWRWIQDVGRVIERTENGVALRAIGVHIDIDQSKRLEHALSSIVSFRQIDSSESMLQHMCRVLTEALDVDIACIAKLDGHGVPSARVIAGWSPEGPTSEFEYDLHGTPCEVTHRSDYCHIENEVQSSFPSDLFLTEVGAASYTGLVLRDSSNEPIGLLVLLDTKGRRDTPESQSMLRLIGARAAAELERHQIEVELHRTRERLLSYADRLETATTGAGLGVFEFRFETGEMIWDDTMHDLYGTGEVEIVPSVELWESRLHPDDLARMQSVRRQIEGGLDHVETSFRVLPGGDTIRYLSVAATVSRHPDGTPISLTGVNWDISDLVHANQSLLRAKEIAESASSAKSEFLANMSHEIRTPLTAIIGYTDLLVHDDQYVRDPAMLSSSLKAVHNNAEHLLVILNDILDLTKIDAGMMQIESVELCPAELIREAAAMLSARAVAKGIGLEVNFLTELPTAVISDPTRIRQILLNLIGNAVKFTDEGHVAVDVSYQSLPDGSGRLVIAVRDTGIGIAADDVKILKNFDPFTQADGSTTRRFGGTGLGLRLTNSFAKRLGGNLSIESELGVGSTFTVAIEVMANPDGVMQHPAPVEPCEHEKTTQRKTIKQDGLSGVRILLVEDGPDNQKLLSYMLGKAGANVSIASNGREAVEIVEQLKEAEKNSYDLVLMDMQMPEIDGYSATAMLRDLGFYGPIIALTAHAMEGDRQRCLNAGCQDYLTKPVPSRVLVEACQKWIGWEWTRQAAA